MLKNFTFHLSFVARAEKLLDQVDQFAGSTHNTRNPRELVVPRAIITNYLNSGFVDNIDQEIIKEHNSRIVLL